ncbi:hypothetical protein N7454_003231 [Penicillium verhagenii]|nr:hypothetical protein N7454_003231 [Penicillium verhagenii]
MGKLSRALTTWKYKGEKENPDKEGFILRTSPGLPQSDLDEMIFYPDWRLRAEWICTKSKSYDSRRTGQIFRFTNNAGKSYDEDDLAIERAQVFRKEKREGVYHYHRLEKTTPIPSLPSRDKEKLGNFTILSGWGYR